MELKILLGMLEKILISVISSLLTLAIVGVFARLRSVELIKLLGGVSRKEFSELKRNTQKIGLTENGNHTTISLGLFSMHFQDDGNVVIYDHKGNPIWDTGTGIKP